MAQQDTQGIFSARLKHLNKVCQTMGDIRINLHPASQDVQVLLTIKEYDHYGDATHTVNEEVVKRALVTKNKGADFVQAIFTDFLVEDTEQMPYMVTMTITGLPRSLQQDDQIVIGGETYTVSRVHIGNRTQDSVIRALVYNEKGNIEQDQINNEEDEDFYSYLDD